MFLTADWPAPANISVVTTTRAGGVSEPPFDQFNLATHVGDDPEAVRVNRERLLEQLALPTEPLWLNQVHGAEVALPGVEAGVTADAAWTDRPGDVLAVLTADCVPVVLCNHAGNELAVAHAGWRGLAEGVLEQVVGQFSGVPERLRAWIGPAIGPEHYEVGPEVREALMAANAWNNEAFAPGAENRWHLDLFAIVRRELARLGVSRVYGGGVCTYADAERFYSYRRDGRTGRMATLAWMRPGT
ncbi:MAG: peptidoglycan editing factor PgeF [Halothiobacillaceae bacterium]